MGWNLLRGDKEPAEHSRGDLQANPHDAQNAEHPRRNIRGSFRWQKSEFSPIEIIGEYVEIIVLLDKPSLNICGKI